MDERLAILAIAEQLLNDSDESELEVDSDLEDEYQEDELFLSLLIQQRKKTLGELLNNARVGGTPGPATTSAVASKPQVKRKRIQKVFKRKFSEKSRISKCSPEKKAKSAANVSSHSDNSTHLGRYSEEVARAMDDVQFKTHFGMTRTTFQVVRYHLQGRIPEKYVDLDTQLMCTLWMLGTQDSYRTTAERFMLSKGTVHFIVMRLCKELAALADIFICWPSEDQYASVSAKFERKTGFPGVVGCVNHMCVKIKHTSSTHSNKPSLHMQIQGVCDADMKFTFLQLWQQGCLHHNTDLVQLAESIGSHYHLLGDLTYPLHTGLMTPYQSSDHLQEWHRKYNDVHRWTQLQIECAFAQLKVRFWRLKSLDMSLKDKVRDVVLACCVLHNIIVDHEGPLDMTYTEITEVLGKGSHGPAPDYHEGPLDMTYTEITEVLGKGSHGPAPDYRQHSNSEASSKREQIARNLR